MSVPVRSNQKVELETMEIAQFLLVLIAIFASAKIFGELAERVGQPAVLGELIAGLVVGVSGLQLLDAQQATIHLLAELGVILLLFMIGLETDLKKLLSVGVSSAAVALVMMVAAACGGPGDGVERPESAEGNERVVEAYVRALNDRDWTALDTLVADEYTRHSQATPEATVRSREDFLASARR
ncbi:MAG: cation:proton antiporter, partial [Acidobacteria bacterium]|nr:cation:proton antiporter [Acidobacteriota bacterium]